MHFKQLCVQQALTINKFQKILVVLAQNSVEQRCYVARGTRRSTNRTAPGGSGIALLRS